MSPLDGAVRRAIAAVNAEVRANPLVFLTEADIQARLYAALLPSFGGIVELMDVSCWGLDTERAMRPVYASRLHSCCLLPTGHVDLAILDLDATMFRFTPKGQFSFARLHDHPGNHIFIEIKVSRTHRSSAGGKSRWLRLLRADLKKLAQYPWRCFLLAYDFGMNGIGAAEIRALKASAGPTTALTYTSARLPNVFTRSAAKNN